MLARSGRAVGLFGYLLGQTETFRGEAVGSCPADEFVDLWQEQNRAGDGGGKVAEVVELFAAEWPTLPLFEVVTQHRVGALLVDPRFRCDWGRGQCGA